MSASALRSAPSLDPLEPHPCDGQRSRIHDHLLPAGEDVGADLFPCHLPCFIVGQDLSGRWLVRDEQGLMGGVFKDRRAAEHFAAFESGHRRGAVRMAPQGLRLDLTGPLPKGLARPPRLWPVSR